MGQISRSFLYLGQSFGILMNVRRSIESTFDVFSPPLPLPRLRRWSRFFPFRERCIKYFSPDPRPVHIDKNSNPDVSFLSFALQAARPLFLFCLLLLYAILPLTPFNERPGRYVMKWALPLLLLFVHRGWKCAVSIVSPPPPSRAGACVSLRW